MLHGNKRTIALLLIKYCKWLSLNLVTLLTLRTLPKETINEKTFEREKERNLFDRSLINTTQSLTGKLIVFLSHDSHELGGICLILMQV